MRNETPRISEQDSSKEEISKHPNRISQEIQDDFQSYQQEVDQIHFEADQFSQLDR